MSTGERSTGSKWRRVLRRSGEALAFVVIVYAVIVVIGRQLLPQLDRYQPEINGYLSRQLGAALHTTGLSGEWTQLTPKLSARGIALAPLATPAEPALRIDRAEAELDLIASLRSGALVWRELRLGKVSLTAIEGADGRWAVSGHSIGGPSSGGLNRLLGTLVLSRLIHIEQLELGLRFYSGATSTMLANHLRAENSAGFHRTIGTLAIIGGGESAQLVVEGKGDPRDLEQFEGRGYLRLDRVNFTGPISAIAKRWFPATVARIGEMNTAVAAQLWFTAQAGDGIEMRGQIHAAEIPLPWTGDLAPVKNLHADLSGWFRAGENWGLRLHGLDFDWADIAIDPLNIEISQALGARRKGLALAADHLDLDTARRVLVATGVAGERGNDILRTLNPRGRLKAVHLDLSLDEKQPIGLRANVEKLAVDPGKDSPGARNISGYLEFAGDQGFFEMDSPDGFAMYYPQAYDDYMAHGSTKGRVNLRWLPEDATIRIAGGPIVLNGEEGQGLAYIYLNLPTAPGGDPEMFLLAGLSNSHSRYSRRYIPKELDPELRHWLDRAVGDVDIPAGGFVWRGSLRRSNPQGRSILVYGKLANGTVDYDPGWPKLTNFAAQFTVDGTHFEAEINQGTLGGARLNRAAVATDRAKNGKMLLNVTAALSAPLQQAVGILARSPLRSRVAMLERWQLGGNTEAELDLAIPLSTVKAGERYRVSARIDHGRMALPGESLVISDIAGTLGYSDGAGLHSDKIAAMLWGQALSGTISTRAGETRVEASGTLAADQLPRWNALVQRGISGHTDYQAVLSLPAGQSPPSLNLTSTLAGLAVTLPAPLGKVAEASRPVTATLKFAPDALYGEASLGEDLKAVARFRDNALERAAISLGGSPAQLPDRPGLLVSGRLARFAINDWLPWYGEDNSGLGLAALRPHFDVHLGELALGSLALTDVALAGDYGAGEGGNGGWQLRADSPVVSGELTLPARGVISARLRHLILPQPTSAENGFLATLDPRRLPEIDFATERLRIGDREFGSLAFNARRLPAGARFSAINANITGLLIGDKAGEDTALEWLVDGGTHNTRFAGTLQSSDIGGVLKAWDLPVVITSREAAFIADLGWNDKPWNFSTALLRGQVALNLEDGGFYRAPGVTTNALIKLVGLVNFDTWLRRLRLNFSDLFAKGVTYDHLRGGLKFDGGRMTFGQPITVDLPSGRMRLLGSADLLAETIDARLVATLPVGTNLPWIAALAGGLPAAAGVYLSGKLFKRQVDKLSSLSYRVTGSWDDPDLDVDKIFTDSTGDKRQFNAESGGDTAKK